ncbi:glycosyltransferase family 4 protein [Lachnoclostridium sp. Marseille-P6806]|uniref:glycosyltransferase family 4 protein n=1 Tax=Lachnoclostridium sp. Marseille-P6806 TaxID=2364793 RepID=UPI001030338C|nr:glycosyltransferase family 4 protein [Lachnoclostridium sp. Marseille-P6806]
MREESRKADNRTGSAALRILVVTECFYPDIYAVNDIVAAMVRRGHRVTVLTGLPDYTTSRIPEEYRHGRNRHEHYRGADVYRVKTIARRRGPIWRSLSYLSFVVSGSVRARMQDWLHTEAWGMEGSEECGDFDVVYVWEVSPVTMAVPAIVLKKRYHKPLFLYCMDIWPECVKAMNIREGSLAYRLIHQWSSHIYRQCDHIAVSSRPFFQYMEEMNRVPADRMSYLPQYAGEEMLERDFRRKRFPKEEAVVSFLFIGNIGRAQNLDTLIQAMTVFRDRTDAVLHMVGGGSELERIRKLVCDLRLDRQVFFYGPRPGAEAQKFYEKADACVLTLDGSTHIGDTLPGKLQTYMAAGKTVLAAANGAAAEVIAESGCGACVPAGDATALGELLLDYAEQPEKYEACGEKAREYFKKHFTEEKHFRELEQKLYQLAENGRGL